MKNIILIMVATSSLVWADFWRDPTTGIVVDTQRYFQWQDDYSDNADSIKEAKWKDAIEYCENLTLGTHDDWRLPNETELLTLVNYNSTTTVVDEFTNKAVGYYWSSTSRDNASKFTVYLGYGYSTTMSHTAQNKIRCIRAGKTSL